MFRYSPLLTAASLALLSSTVQAHMILDTPVPFDKVNLNNSPLDNDGNNFPCKFGKVVSSNGTVTGTYGAIVTSMNSMKVGEPQTLSFIGGATHGGGSCQVSLTPDIAPAKDSEWKVIHTIIGGCPSNNTGNLSGNAAGTDASVYSYAIPRGIPNGRYSLAWTWFNKLGNREMYMVCAPISVIGGSSKLKRATSMPAAWNKLPDMFVANIPNSRCELPPGKDLIFPPAFQSGAPAETYAGSSLVSGTVGGAGCASMTKMGAANGKAAVVAAPTSAATSPYAASSYAPAMLSSASASAPVASIPVPHGSGNAGASIPAPSVAPPYPSVAASTPVSAVPSAPAPASGSGSCAAGRVECSGTLICVGSNQFALCENGCGVPQQLAVGTHCSKGMIAKRQVPVARKESAWRKVVFW